MDRGPWQGTVHGVAKVGHELTTKHHQQQQMYRCKIPTLKKKNEILPIATTWMNLEGILPSEINKIH